ncbi:MAG: FeS assembly protein SufD [Xanthobacteraceae bacterium]|nr:FeS assembly protein SufD [Xanthobacteraceae bacterium]
MNAEIRHIKTSAETGLAQEFAAARAKLPGQGAVAALRDTAFARFDAKGLPHRRVEEWKYTDLRALMRDARPLAPAPDQAGKARAAKAGQLMSDVDVCRIVFADGVLVPELSDLVGLEPGLSIRSMAQALGSADPLVARHLGQVFPSDDAALALNTALMGDGALIEISDGATMSRPIHLVFATVSETPVAIFPRSLVVIGKGARATLIESHEGPDAVGHQCNAALELIVADGAEVEHIKLTTGASETLHISTLMASLGADVRFNSFAFTTGLAVVRNQVFLRFDGAGTKAGIRGASLLRGKQHADTTLVIDHAQGGCESRELFKSVLDDEARGVFQGKIIVRQHAQKTDGKMMANALLLSDDAEADSKPELEIFADDVVCGHGSTVGALNEDLRFYLMARGVPKHEAESLLIQAFVGEAVEFVADEIVRDALMEAAVRWLAERG